MAISFLLWLSFTVVVHSLQQLFDGDILNPSTTTTTLTNFPNWLYFQIYPQYNCSLASEAMYLVAIRESECIHDNTFLSLFCRDARYGNEMCSKMISSYRFINIRSNTSTSSTINIQAQRQLHLFKDTQCSNDPVHIVEIDSTDHNNPQNSDWKIGECRLQSDEFTTVSLGLWTEYFSDVLLLPFAGEHVQYE